MQPLADDTPFEIERLQAAVWFHSRKCGSVFARPNTGVRDRTDRPRGAWLQLIEVSPLRRSQPMACTLLYVTSITGWSDAC